MKDKKTVAIIIAVGIGSFMAALDVSVVNLAMPLIEKQFGISMSTVMWIITAYLLIVSSLLLIYGRMNDMYGQKRIYLTGFFIFVIGSVLCGSSVSIAMLVVFRVVQALGAGMIYATGPVIITNSVLPEVRGRALSVQVVGVALGLTSGPLIGGILATHVGWPSIFYINVPVGITVIIMVVKFVPGFKPKGGKVPFDIPGSILVFFALLLVLLPLNVYGSGAYPPALLGVILGSGIVLAAVFVLVERRQKHPMLNVRLFKNRVFAGSNVAAIFIYIAQYILIFLSPFYLQTLRGYTPDYAGLLYMPLPLASLCVAPLSGILSDRVDSRFVSGSGALIMALGLFMLGLMGSETHIAYIVVSMAVTGLGFGFFQTPNYSAIMGSVSPQNRGVASGALALMRNIGMALGVAVSGALFAFFNKMAGGTFAISDQAANASIDTGAFVFAFHNTLNAAVIIALLSTAASFLKGRVLTEKQRKRMAVKGRRQ